MIVVRNGFFVINSQLVKIIQGQRSTALGLQRFYPLPKPDGTASVLSKLFKIKRASKYRILTQIVQGGREKMGRTPRGINSVERCGAIAKKVRQIVET
jgi:hypothetical protein